MSGAVKRPYDNSRRQAQTRATKAEVVDAARRLFIEGGYPATTIETISEQADVPVATVYRLFGSKRGILSAVLDVSFGGDDQPVAFSDRPDVQGALAEPHPGRLLEAFAGIARQLLDRSATVQHVLATAANVDLEAAELLTEIRRQRLSGQSRIVEALQQRSALANGLDPADAADTVYTLMSPEVYRILTVERRWPADRYQNWLAGALKALLLPRPSRTPKPSRSI